MISLLPSWCVNCRCFILRSLRSPSPFLCSNCFDRLPVIEQPTCDHCGLDHTSSLCRETWARDINTFDSLFYYRDSVQRWIVTHKYSGGILAGRLLCGFVTNWFEENGSCIGDLDAVIPVPIDSLRLRRRGFNQTAFLLRRQQILPIKVNWLKKIRRSSQQAGLTGRERLENVRGAFRARGDVVGKRLLVFDDVCTTGQTLGEVCRSLKAAGAEAVHVLTLSRSM